jgi:hypothetical protein
VSRITLIHPFASAVQRLVRAGGRPARLSLLAVAVLGLSAPAVRADYIVWTCYGGQWWASAQTPSYSQAQNYAQQFRNYGYTTTITDSRSKPTQGCGTPAQKCLYYAYVSYNGRYGYLGGYTTQSAADYAGRSWAASVGRGAYYWGTYKYCQ